MLPEEASFCPECGWKAPIDGSLEDVEESESEDVEEPDEPEAAESDAGGAPEALKATSGADLDASGSDLENQFWKKWDDLIDRLDHGIPWNAVFLTLSAGFLLLTYFTNK